MAPWDPCGGPWEAWEREREREREDARWGSRGLPLSHDSSSSIEPSSGLSSVHASSGGRERERWEREREAAGDYRRAQHRRSQSDLMGDMDGVLVGGGRKERSSSVESLRLAAGGGGHDQERERERERGRTGLRVVQHQHQQQQQQQQVHDRREQAQHAGEKGAGGERERDSRRRSWTGTSRSAVQNVILQKAPQKVQDILSKVPANGLPPKIFSTTSTPDWVPAEIISPQGISPASSLSRSGRSPRGMSPTGQPPHSLPVSLSAPPTTSEDPSKLQAVKGKHTRTRSGSGFAALFRPAPQLSLPPSSGRGAAGVPLSPNSANYQKNSSEAMVANSKHSSNPRTRESSPMEYAENGREREWGHRDDSKIGATRGAAMVLAEPGSLSDRHIGAASRALFKGASDGERQKLSANQEAPQQQLRGRHGGLSPPSDLAALRGRGAEGQRVRVEKEERDSSPEAQGAVGGSAYLFPGGVQGSGRGSLGKSMRSLAGGEGRVGEGLRAGMEEQEEVEQREREREEAQMRMLRQREREQRHREKEEQERLEREREEQQISERLLNTREWLMGNLTMRGSRGVAIDEEDESSSEEAPELRERERGGAVEDPEEEDLLHPEREQLQEDTETVRGREGQRGRRGEVQRYAVDETPDAERASVVRFSVGRKLILGEEEEVGEGREQQRQKSPIERGGSGREGPISYQGPKRQQGGGGGGGYREGRGEENSHPQRETQPAVNSMPKHWRIFQAIPVGDPDEDALPADVTPAAASVPSPPPPSPSPPPLLRPISPIEVAPIRKHAPAVMPLASPEQASALSYKPRSLGIRSALGFGRSREKGVNILQRPFVSVHEDFHVYAQELGRGRFGVIRVCVHRQTGERLACKSISKGRLKCAQDLEDVRREVAVMELLRGHPDVVHLKGTYEDPQNVHLVMELCEGGELFDRIKLRKFYPEREAAIVCRTIAEVLRYCHSRGVMHRDLKPENILLCSPEDHTTIKVIDYGVAAFFKKGKPCKDMAGSPFYLAPEVLAERYGPAADVWSAGVVLYILLSGIPPFWAASNEGIFEAIREGKLNLARSPWPAVSEAGKDLVRRMLTRDPKKRITPEEILGHPFITRR